MANVRPLAGLHPYEYEHPFDEKALNALQKTPGLDTAVRQFNKHAIERAITVQYTGSNLRITKKSYPKIHRLLDIVCETINLPARPSLYVKWEYSINGSTTGVDNPIVVLTSGAIDLLSDKELLCLLGHEAGHIKSHHVLYHQMAQALPIIGDALGKATLGVGKLLSYPLQLALFRWRRMSEFTADRAGLLACQDVEVATKVMMKMAGMPINQYDDMKLDQFVSQARQFESLDYEKLNKAAKYLLIMNQTHPWTVMRSAELLNWIEEGEYQRVIDRDTSHKAHIREAGDSQFCRKCGYRLQGGERFCNSCGTKLR